MDLTADAKGGKRRRLRAVGRPAFTLVELLVVVAIIALLLTLLMPSLGRAKMLARAAMCGANLRAIYVGIRLYAEDNENFFPGARYGRDQIAFGQDQVTMTLPGQICPKYLEDPEGFFCPAQERNLGGAPHPFFESEGGNFDAMHFESYRVGSPEWARNDGNRRLAKFLSKHLCEVFAYLRHPGMAATNYRGEQSIRPAVVNRKVWGGNRTWLGAWAQSVLMSVIGTCLVRRIDPLNFFIEALTSRNPVLLAQPPP